MTKNTPIQVIHHSADYDGLFSKAPFLNFTDVEYTGWDFGDPIPNLRKDAKYIFVIDLPFDCNPNLVNDDRLVWIDHHKTNIDRVPKNVNGYWIDGVAASRLAWQYVINGVKPTKQEYVDRKVDEPYVIQLVGEYDIWDKRDINGEALQYWLDICDLSKINILDYVSFTKQNLIKELKNGKWAMGWHLYVANSISKEKAYIIEFEGLKFLTLCSCHARGSNWFPQNYNGKYDALLAWRIGPTSQIGVSLYHAPGNEKEDLSIIAKKYGGGGHRGACGFEIKYEDGIKFFKPENK